MQDQIRHAATNQPTSASFKRPAQPAP
jgi:hypothetical protein